MSGQGENTDIPVITIDGPSGVGKGTICQLLARQLGWHLLDSGALYRLTALAAQQAQVALDDEEALALLAGSLDVAFEPSCAGEPVRVLLAGCDVTAELRTEVAGNNASLIAPLSKVRAALLQRQRDFAQWPGLVADGRDMGTVVFPSARTKIFMTASAQERAQRRHKQLLAKGLDVKIGDLLQEIQVRDERDMNRPEAPLRPADDAVVIDTTGLDIEQVLECVLIAADRE